MIWAVRSASDVYLTRVEAFDLVSFAIRLVFLAGPSTVAFISVFKRTMVNLLSPRLNACCQIGFVDCKGGTMRDI